MVDTVLDSDDVVQDSTVVDDLVEVVVVEVVVDGRK
jgi:hypothetical protein